MKIRAKDKDSKEVVGWYVEIGGKPFVIEDPTPMTMGLIGEYLPRKDMIAIDISTAAVDTGKDDKNGNRIFGSRGEMQGGDRVRVYGSDNRAEVEWSKHQQTWCIWSTHLCDYSPADLEIIPDSD